ncbi:hypothetical protein HU200_012949 [Digitaria exilis]|uniref:PIR2-like helical domain-containing protein n=1 Tax=Digitaria exilis TaxID=1010633 RepID=A0A835FDW9_9POAL|nr:hypothetical protein HU200_012949 [Digitaria exilis]
MTRPASPILLSDTELFAAAMGEHVYAAVIGEVAGKAVSKMINALAKRRPSVDDKLQRLEMLVIKLRGTVEMSERVGAETASLLQWRGKLREAASTGHQVLLSFHQRRAGDAAACERGAESSAVVSLARDTVLGMARGVRSATAALLSCSECAVTFTRNTLLAMARGFRSATTMTLSCSGEHVVKLNCTVERLEKTCTDMGEFIKLLQVEASQANALDRPTKRKRTAPIKSTIQNVGVAGNEKKMEVKEKNRHGEEDALPLDAAAADQGALADALAMSTAVQRLQDALAEISRAVARADGLGLADLEWLVELAEALREDTCAIDNNNAKASVVVSKEVKMPGVDKKLQRLDRRAIVNSNAKASVVISKELKLLGVDKKLQRLEMLVVKLRSTLEVSEMLGAETTSSLLQWRDKLREAASKGHQVLLSFQRRVMGADAATAGGIKEHRGAGGKSVIVAFITKALLGMAKGVEIVTTESLFDGEKEEDEEKKFCFIIVVVEEDVDEVAVTAEEMLDIEERTRRRSTRLLFPLSSSSPSLSSSFPSSSSPSPSSGEGAGGVAAAAAARAMPSVVVRFQAALAEISRAEEISVFNSDGLYLGPAQPMQNRRPSQSPSSPRQQALVLCPPAAAHRHPGPQDKWGPRLCETILECYESARDRLPTSLIPCIHEAGFCFGFLDPVSNIIVNTLLCEAASSSDVIEAEADQEEQGRRLVTFLTSYFRYLHTRDALYYLSRSNADLLVAVYLIEEHRCASCTFTANHSTLCCAICKPSPARRICVQLTSPGVSSGRVSPPVGIDHELSMKRLLLDKIHGFYLEAISRLPATLLRSRLHRALLKAGYCYGPFDPVSNILLNTIWYDTTFPAQHELKMDVILMESLGIVESRSLRGLKYLITNDYLLKWQETLKEAAADGDEVLFTFPAVLREADELAKTALIDTRAPPSRQPAAQCGLGRDEARDIVRSLEILAADVESFGGFGGGARYGTIIFPSQPNPNTSDAGPLSFGSHPPAPPMTLPHLRAGSGPRRERRPPGPRP